MEKQILIIKSMAYLNPLSACIGAQNKFIILLFLITQSLKKTALKYDPNRYKYFSLGNILFLINFKSSNTHL